MHVSCLVPLELLGLCDTIASREQIEKTSSRSKSSLASYSNVESFAFGQLFISPFPQTSHCKMRDWKNIAEKYHRENIKVKNNSGKGSVFLGFKLLHPHQLACYEYYYFLWPSLNNDLIWAGTMFPQDCLFLRWNINESHCANHTEGRVNFNMPVTSTLKSKLPLKSAYYLALLISG